MKTFFILFLFCAANSFAQVNIQWQSYYRGADSLIDRSSTMARDNSGNIYIVGLSTRQATGTDILTVKYNSSGIFQWARTYNGSDSSSDVGNGIAVDNAGNVYVIGTARNANVDAVLIKYDPSGTMQWVKTHNGTGNGYDEFNDVYVDGGGNIYAVGNIRNTNSDLLAVKYNAAGTLLWQVAYNAGTANEDGLSVTVGDSGNVYVSGSTASTGSTYVDMLLIKINSSGITQWGRTYAGVGIGVDEAFSVATGDSGNVYITGNSYGGTGTNYDVTTIKYGLDGTRKWVVKYDPPEYQRGAKILTDDSGYVYVMAKTGDYTVIKYGSDGEEIWTSHYNGPHNYIDEPNDMCMDSHGNLYVTGYVEDTTAADGSFYPRTTTVKYSPQGAIVWSIIDTEYSTTWGVTCDNNGNVYVTGDISAGTSGTQIQTIAYSSSIGIQQISSEIPKGFTLSQNYPNPFNPSTRIKFEIPANSFIKLAVYDIMGREVATLVNSQLNAGVYEYAFDAQNLSTGVYFYKLVTEGMSETKKMLLVK